MIVAHVSYVFLAFGAAIHILSAYCIAFFFAEIIKTKAIYFFPPAYLLLVSLSAYLILRNGRWGVDSSFVYKGWRLSPFFSISEIEYAQVGLPDMWVSAIARIPGTHMQMVDSLQNTALVLRLSGNRWFIWQFMGMVNHDQFVTAVLQLSPNKGHVDASLKVPVSVNLMRVGTIIQA